MSKSASASRAPRESPAAILRDVGFRAGSRADTTTGESVEQRFAEGTTLVSIEQVDLPTEVRPGDVIPVTFTVQNSEAISTLGDPDSCFATPIATGFSVDAIVRLDGFETDQDRRCVAIQGGTETVTLTARAPTTPGEATITLEAVGARSGHVGATTERTVDVVEDADPQPCPPGFERNDAGECVPVDDGNGGGDLARNVIIILGLFLGIVTILAAN